MGGESPAEPPPCQSSSLQSSSSVPCSQPLLQPGLGERGPGTGQMTSCLENTGSQRGGDSQQERGGSGMARLSGAPKSKRNAVFWSSQSLPGSSSCFSPSPHQSPAAFLPSPLIFSASRILCSPDRNCLWDTLGCTVPHRVSGPAQDVYGAGLVASLLPPAKVVPTGGTGAACALPLSGVML